MSIDDASPRNVQVGGGPKKTFFKLGTNVEKKPMINRKPAIACTGTYFTALTISPKSSNIAHKSIMITPAATGHGDAAVAEMIAPTGAPPNITLGISARLLITVRWSMFCGNAGGYPGGDVKPAVILPKAILVPIFRHINANAK